MKTDFEVILPSTREERLSATRPGRTGLSNGRLGMILLIGTETVLFASFISAYMVLRLSANAWPPYGTPKLVPGLSVLTTLLLIASSVWIARWRFLFKTVDVRGIRKLVATTAAAGTVFLLLQAVEFSRLYSQGLTLKGLYGAVFYALVTCHAIHVAGGLAIFALVLARLHTMMAAHTALLSAAAMREWLGHAELYWHFVTGIWIVLFGMFYLL